MRYVNRLHQSCRIKVKLINLLYSVNELQNARMYGML